VRDPGRQERVRTGRLDLIPLVVFLLAALVRVIVVLQLRDTPFFSHPIIDEKTYDDWARAIAHGALLPHNVFWQPPLFAYWLAFVYSVTGGGYLAARLTEAVLGAGVATLTYYAGRQFLSRPAAIVGALCVAFYGPLVLYDTTLLSATLASAFLLCSLLALGRGVEAGDTRRIGLGGLFIGLLAVTRGEALLLLPLVMLWLLLGQPRAVQRTQCVRWAALVGVCALVPIGCVTVVNRVAGHDWVVVSSNGGVNFYIGNNPAYDQTVGIRPGEDWERLVREPVARGITRPSAQSAYFYEKGLAFAVRETRAWMSLQARKVVLALNAREIQRDLDPYSFRDTSPVLAVLLVERPWALPFGLVGPLAFLGMLLAVTQGQRVVLLYLAALTQAMALVMFFVTARYRLPLVPLLCLFAGYSSVWIVERWRAREWGRLRTAFAVLVLATAIVNAPRVPARTAREVAEQEYYTGYAYAEEGRLDDALRSARRAQSLDPRYAKAALFEGYVLSQKHDPIGAENAYRRALQLAPDYAEAHQGLGNLYASRGDFALAEREMRRAIALRRPFADAHYYLAQVLLRLGRRADARAELEETVREQPLFARACLALGSLYLEDGDADRALDAFARAVRITPSDPDAHARRAYALARVGRSTEARTAAERALALDPTNRTALAVARGEVGSDETDATRDSTLMRGR
jgi:Flp pilus assembly protein TadD